MAQYLTGTPFRQWDINTVKAAAGGQLSDMGKKALLYYQGDHWQGGLGWGGPSPDPLTTKAADVTAFMLKVEKAFTSSNVLAEVVDRHVSAVMGRPPGWQFVPLNAPEGAEEGPEVPEPGKEAKKPAKAPEVTEIEAAITNWVDKRNAHQFIQQAAADYATTGRGSVRLFIPPGLLESGGIPSGLDLEAALDLVYIEKVDPDKGGTACDKNTMAQGAYVLWSEKVQQGGGQQTVDRLELQFTERNGRKAKTVLRSWTGTTESTALELDLGGLLLMHTMDGKPIVTDQLMQLQRGLNFALTAMGNNNANAGFMERIITNAQLPGTYEDDGKGGKVFKALDKYPGGPGATVYLTGQPVRDDDGKITGYTEPKPWFRDPSSPEAYTATLAEYRAAMYMETKQGHLLAQGDGSISGASRVHLRADFELSLRDTTVAAEGAYRWLLAVLAKLGALFSGNATKYDNLRPTVQANVNSGPLTDAEREAITTQYEKGLRARETAMVLLGVDDPDAEFQRIVGEKPSNPVGLDDLAALGIELLPEQVATLMQRAGLTVTPEQLAQLKVNHDSNQQLRASAAQARDRALNPQDQPPADQNPTE